jgi:hypothetical protein
MKRAIFILVAALLVLLVYPSTHPYAKSAKPGVITGPAVITPFSGTGPPIALSGDSEDDSDDGDADDLSGYKDKDSRPEGSTVGPVGQNNRITLYFTMWWNYMFRVR